MGGYCKFKHVYTVWQIFLVGTRKYLPCLGGGWWHFSPDTVPCPKKNATRGRSFVPVLVRVATDAIVRSATPSPIIIYTYNIMNIRLVSIYTLIRYIHQQFYILSHICNSNKHLYFKSSYDENNCFQILKTDFKNTCKGFY